MCSRTAGGGAAAMPGSSRSDAGTRGGLRPWDRSVPCWALAVSVLILAAWAGVSALVWSEATQVFSRTGGRMQPSDAFNSVKDLRRIEDKDLFQFKTWSYGRRLIIVMSGPNDMTADADVHAYFASLAFAVQHIRELGPVPLAESYTLGALRGSADWMLSPDKRHMIFTVLRFGPSLPYSEALSLLNNIRYSLARNRTVPGEPHVRENADQLNPMYKIEITGDIAIGVETHSIVKDSLPLMEKVILPAAFLVLVYFLKSLRLLLVPLLSVTLSIVLSFYAATVVAKFMSLPHEAPQLTISICVALSIDFSLFLLVRFVEGLRNNLSLWDAVLEMLRHSGRTVLVSSCLMAVAFCCSIGIPVEMFQASGLVMGTASLITVLSALTMTPALLLVLGRFLVYPLPFGVGALTAWLESRPPSRYEQLAHGSVSVCGGTEAEEGVELVRMHDSDSDACGEGGGDVATCQGEGAAAAAASGDSGGEGEGAGEQEEEDEGAQVAAPEAGSAHSEGEGEEKEEGADEEAADLGGVDPAVTYNVVDERNEAERMKKKTWFKVGLWVAKMGRSFKTTLAMLLLMSVPLVVAAGFVRVTVSRKQMAPRGIPSIDALNRLEEYGFQTGRLQPASVMIEITDVAAFGTDTLRSRAGFDAYHRVHKEILDSFKPFERPGLHAKNDSVLSPAVWENKVITYEEAEAFRACVYCKYERAQVYMLPLNTNRHDAMLNFIFVPFASHRSVGVHWYRFFRKRIDDINAEGLPYTLYFEAEQGFDSDVATVLAEYTPKVVVAMALFSMVFVGLVFRSFFLPWRLGIVLAYSVVCTLGIAVLTYQTSMLWWLFPYLREQENEGLAYTVPTIVLPVCIALGLDYDIFLITRVYEMRGRGYSDIESVILGVAHTGATISGAGVIMSIAFGGLLLASTTHINQLGLLLMVSVLLDTFYIRTVLVPFLMVRAGPRNWYPRRFPEPTRTIFWEPEEREALKLPPLDSLQVLPPSPDVEQPATPTLADSGEA